jgi:glyoxylase-like metal-dependent hydrolase (beta-lactamase superfamily II)
VETDETRAINVQSRETGSFVDLGNDVVQIDTGFRRQQFDAAYLIVQGGQGAFVDTGTNASVPELLRSLEFKNIDRGDVRWVIATHVHLDHAGGAGALLQHLPNARLVVHPQGAAHLIGPARLIAGVRAVYGDEVAKRDYGEIVPISADRVLTTHDEMEISLGGRILRFMHTPGHARHHHCIVDEKSAGCFVGDTLGISYPQICGPHGRYIMPSTTPVQFDPQALRKSVERLVEQRFDVAYLTHFGLLSDIYHCAGALLPQIDEMCRITEKIKDGDALRKALRELAAENVSKIRCDSTIDECLQLLELDIELNAQGLEVWHARQTAS